LATFPNAAHASDGDSLTRYLLLAQNNNPSIAAARSSADAKKRAVRLARTLPDPSVSAGYFVSEVETRVGPQKGKIGASQKIPWPGKLAAKRSIAEREFDAAQERLRAAEARVFARIREAYSLLYATGKEIEFTAQSLKLLHHMESVLLAKYSTAAASQAEVLKMQVETAVLEDRLKSLDATAVKLKQQLRALLNVDTSYAVAFPSDLPALEIPSHAPELIESAIENNPQAAEARFKNASARASVGLARQSLAPDIMLMTDYIFTGRSNASMVSPDENGKDPWVIGASVTIPLWASNKSARVAKARDMHAARKATQENIENMVSAKSIGLLEAHGDAERKLDLHERVLVPKAQQALSLTQEAYINARATVLDFLDAWRMLLNLQIATENHRAKKEIIAGGIDMLLGGEPTRSALESEPQQ
jgi:outer membrane protein TolC